MDEKVVRNPKLINVRIIEGKASWGGPKHEELVQLGDYRIIGIPLNLKRARLWQATHNKKQISILECKDTKPIPEEQVALLRSISTPAVPKILDYVFDEVRGASLFVLESVEGETLEQYANKMDITNKDEADDLMLDLLHTAEKLHTNPEKPIIHRDICNRNILRKGDGTVALLDFWASARKGHIPEGYADQDKLDFRSPEIERGETGTASSDLYSIAAVYLWRRTGRSAYDIKRHAKLPKRLEPRTRRFLSRCLDEDQSKRFASAKKMKDEFEITVANPSRGLRLLDRIQRTAENIADAIPEPIKRILQSVGAYWRITIGAPNSIAKEEARSIIEQKMWLFARLTKTRQQKILQSAEYKLEEKAAKAKQIVLSGHLPKGIASTIGMWIAPNDSKELFTFLEPHKTSLIKKVEKNNLCSLIARNLSSEDATEFVLKGWEIYSSNILDSLLGRITQPEDFEKLFAAKIWLKSSAYKKKVNEVLGLQMDEKSAAAVLKQGEYIGKDKKENEFFEKTLLSRVKSSRLIKELAVCEHEFTEATAVEVAKRTDPRDILNILRTQGRLSADGNLQTTGIRRNKKIREIYAARMMVKDCASALREDLINSRYGEILAALKMSDNTEADAAVPVLVEMAGFSGSSDGQKRRNHAAEAILKEWGSVEFGLLGIDQQGEKIDNPRGNAQITAKIEKLISDSVGDQNTKINVAIEIRKKFLFYLMPVICRLYSDSDPGVSREAARTLLALARERMSGARDDLEPETMPVKISAELDEETRNQIIFYGNDYFLFEEAKKFSDFGYLASVIDGTERK